LIFFWGTGWRWAGPERDPFGRPGPGTVGLGNSGGGLEQAADVSDPPADPAGGERPVQGGGLLPGAAEGFGQVAGEGELGERGHNQADPAVGLLGGAELGRDQAQGALPEPERVLLKPSRTQWKNIRDSEDYQLSTGPTDGLTDDFLCDVSRAYAAALARGERPNVAISEQVGHPVKTVQRWVYLARQRGIMPRGRQGAPG
jgi:hypothetical protein